MQVLHAFLLSNGQYSVLVRQGVSHIFAHAEAQAAHEVAFNLCTRILYSPAFLWAFSSTKQVETYLALETLILH